MSDNKVYLITGGTGSFGQAIVRDLLTKGIRQIRVFSRDELKQAQMKELINDPRVDYLCGDVRDLDRVLMATEGVDVVIHAAAMKRIEKCEIDPYEAIKTNIQGSINLTQACLKNNIKDAVLISTDKAAYAINLYGATKLVAEKIWIQSNVYRGLHHPTKFSVVRYGNVIGSRGSVLHLFMDQKEKGKLKITDAEMTRFFITIQEAVDLVQVALEMHQGGEIFVPNLKAASIYQIAHLIAGTTPIEITNQRGGEKIHETLVTREEYKRIGSFGVFNVINPEICTWPYLPWTSEYKEAPPSSKEATKYTDLELEDLIKKVFSI